MRFRFRSISGVNKITRREESQWFTFSNTKYSATYFFQISHLRLFTPSTGITNAKLGIVKLSLRMTIQCLVFHSFPMPFKVRTHACSLTASYCPPPTFQFRRDSLEEWIKYAEGGQFKNSCQPFPLSKSTAGKFGNAAHLFKLCALATTSPPPPSQLTKLQERQDSNTSKIISIQSQKYPALVLFCNLWGWIWLFACV